VISTLNQQNGKDGTAKYFMGSPITFTAVYSRVLI